MYYNYSMTNRIEGNPEGNAEGSDLQTLDDYIAIVSKTAARINETTRRARAVAEEFRLTAEKAKTVKIKHTQSSS